MKSFKEFLKESYTVYLVVTIVLVIIALCYVLFFKGSLLYAILGVVGIILLMIVVEYIMWSKGH